jgi:adenylylsulfate kinase-like enzyme
MRATICRDLDLSREGRWENNLRIARLARSLANQGFTVVVSTICPYRDLRVEVRKITDCKFIQLDGGIVHPDYPYEY